MWSKLVDIIKSLVPEIAQYPIKRLNKTYENLFYYKRKKKVTQVRTVCELCGGMVSMLLMCSPTINQYLIGLASQSISSSLGCQVIVYAGLFFSGYSLLSYISKQILRRYHATHNDGITNSEYIGLTVEELEGHKKRAHKLSHEITKGIYAHMVKRILHLKKKAEQSKREHVPLVESHHHVKSQLQIFRSLGIKDSPRIDSTHHFLAHEIVRLTKKNELAQAEIDLKTTPVTSARLLPQSISLGSASGIELSVVPMQSQKDLAIMDDSVVEVIRKKINERKGEIQQLKRFLWYVRHPGGIYPADKVAASRIEEPTAILHGEGVVRFRLSPDVIADDAKVTGEPPISPSSNLDEVVVDVAPRAPADVTDKPILREVTPVVVSASSVFSGNAMSAQSVAAVPISVAVANS